MIQVFYFSGCPHHDPTLALVREVAEELGLAANIEAVEIRDVEQAARMEFLGSPTVKVSGVDIEPAARERREYAIACRRYGRSGIPPRAMGREALAAGAAA